MELIVDHAGKHWGRPGLVICGGPSAATTIETRNPDAVTFSANEHGVELYPDCDYIVACDHRHQRWSTKMYNTIKMQLVLRAYKKPIITHRFYGDIRIPDRTSDAFHFNSGFWAIYAAYLMGCNPIRVIGMDFYKTGTYWHNSDAKSSSQGKGDDFFLDMAKQIKDLCPGIGIEADEDSLLNDVFDGGDTATHLETLARYKEREWFWVQLVKDATVSLTPLLKDTVIPITENEFNMYGAGLTFFKLPADLRI